MVSNEIFTDFDKEDNFKDCIRELNNELNSLNMRFILYFNDIYSACLYSLFLLDTKFADDVLNEWEDEYISLEEI